MREAVERMAWALYELALSEAEREADTEDEIAEGTQDTLDMLLWDEFIIEPGLHPKEWGETARIIDEVVERVMTGKARQRYQARDLANFG